MHIQLDWKKSPNHLLMASALNVAPLTIIIGPFYRADQSAIQSAIQSARRTGRQTNNIYLLMAKYGRQQLQHRGTRQTVGNIYKL